MPKKPTRGAIRNELQVGGGTEGTARVAFGSGGAINDKLSYRFDISGNRSSNWVDRGNSRNLSISGALRYDVSADLYVTASYAQGFQHPMQYFGVPLVNGARDRALDKKNYNVGDSDIAFRDSWATVAANWQPSDSLNVTSTLYRMKSNRHWKDAEYYTYLPSTAQVRRSSFTEIFHDQEQYGNVTAATVTAALLGMRNTFSTGFEFNHTTFQHDNNSPYSGTSTVDPFNFDPGSFINTAGTYPKYRSQANQYALFAENRLEITPRWSVIGGLRYDHASVNRDDLVNGGAFTKVFANTGWRIGTVYDVQPGLAVYGQYSVAADPISSLLSLNASKANFTLATGRQIEIGVKQSFLGGKAEWTLAAYRIVKSNLLTADPLNPNQSIQIGQQSSRARGDGRRGDREGLARRRERVDPAREIRRLPADVRRHDGVARGQRAGVGAAAAREPVGELALRAGLDGHRGRQVRRQAFRRHREPARDAVVHDRRPRPRVEAAQGHDDHRARVQRIQPALRAVRVLQRDAVPARQRPAARSGGELPVLMRRDAVRDTRRRCACPAAGACIATSPRRRGHSRNRMHALDRRTAAARRIPRRAA